MQPHYFVAESFEIAKK